MAALYKKYGISRMDIGYIMAAGTGKFMEVIAQISETTIDQVGALSLESASPCDINSTCVVFAQSEVISLVARKVDRHDILMTGGGALNTDIHRAFEEVVLCLFRRLQPLFPADLGAEPVVTRLSVRFFLLMWYPIQAV